MSYKILYVFVEGDDDERFFKQVIYLKLSGSYSNVFYIQYAREKNEKINKFIKSIDSMPYGDYILLSDIDNHSSVKEKKSVLKAHYSYLNLDKIYIVINEIESWYYAGVNEKIAKKLKIECPTCTDIITKEAFNKIIPSKFRYRLDFMIELLKEYCFETGKEKNKSLNHLAKSYNI